MRFALLRFVALDGVVISKLLDHLKDLITLESAAMVGVDLVENLINGFGDFTFLLSSYKIMEVVGVEGSHKFNL